MKLIAVIKRNTPPVVVALFHFLRNLLKNGRLGTSAVNRFVSGFHSGIYAECNDLPQAIDPVAHYRAHGDPAGPWSYPVFFVSTPCLRTKFCEFPVALHIHAYYTDLLQEIISAIRYNTTVPDIFVSVATQKDKEFVYKTFQQNSFPVREVLVVPNKGRDIGPLLTAFGRTLVENYSVIGHVHTKKTLDIADRELIKRWRTLLIENVIGGAVAGAMMDTSLAMMYTQKNIGAVLPDDEFSLGWTQNYAIAAELVKRIPKLCLPKHFIFPIGMYCWLRAEILKPLVDYGFTWDDYPDEPLPYDGTVLHALERLLGVLPQHSGYTTLTTRVNGITR